MSLRVTLWRASFYKRLSFLSINTPKSSWDRPLEFSILGDEYTCYQTPTKEGGLRGSPTVMIKTTKSCAFVTEGLVPSTHRFLTHFRDGFTEKIDAYGLGISAAAATLGSEVGMWAASAASGSTNISPFETWGSRPRLPCSQSNSPSHRISHAARLRRPPACQGLFNCQPFSWAPTLYF